MMELARGCLDTPEDPFPGQRQYIVECHEDVKTQQEQIGSLVEQASILLSEILQNEEVDYIKGRQFDNVIREAKVQIESCKRRLSGAEQAMSELFEKMNTVKWTSRGLRATGMGPRLTSTGVVPVMDKLHNRQNFKNVVKFITINFRMLFNAGVIKFLNFVCYELFNLQFKNEPYSV